MRLHRFAKNFFAVFGLLWLFVQPIAFFWLPKYVQYGLTGYLTLVVVSLAITAIVSWPKSIVSGKLPVSDTIISIKKGDILDQVGNVIIGVPDTFDTEIGDVISAGSLQGQFQARFFPNTSDLDKALDNALAGVKGKVDKEKTRGKSIRFPTGTTGVINRGENRYFLVAYTVMRRDLRVESDICTLASALKECWETIRTRGANGPVHVAIIGSGLARIGLSRSLLIQFIVLSFLDAQKRGSLTSQLTIYVHESDIEHIRFSDLGDWLKGLVRLA